MLICRVEKERERSHVAESQQVGSTVGNTPRVRSSSSQLAVAWEKVTEINGSAACIVATLETAELSNRNRITKIP